MSEQKIEMSRRGFLKAGGAAMGAAILSGVTGCGNNTTVYKPSNTVAATDTFGKLGKADETQTTDIVVLGSGISGMTAAIQAAKLGAKVIVLEKNTNPGGTSAHTEFIIHPLSPEVASEVLYEDLGWHNYSVNTLLMKDYLEHSIENVDWLINTIGDGTKASLFEENSVGINPNCYTYKVAPGERTGGSFFMREAVKCAKALGVTILTSTPATGIHVSNGKVTGVQATSYANGTTKVIDINAKAVISATASAASDKTLFAQTQWSEDQYMFGGLPGMTGDGAKLAKIAGMGEITDIHPMMVGYGIKTVYRGEDVYAAAGQEPTNVWVNSNGLRFGPENSLLANNARQQGPVYAIMDMTSIERMEQWGFYVGWGRFCLRAVPKPDLQKQMDELIDKKDPYSYRADTIEELATKIGILPANLTATITKYNADCVAGVDTLWNKHLQNQDMMMYYSTGMTPFGKDPRFTPIPGATSMVLLTKGPFYAFRIVPCMLVAMGGIRVNINMEVITEAFKPIPGLYAAGMDCSGYSGQAYALGVAFGSGQGVGCHTGRIAGKNAAIYAGITTAAKAARAA